MKILVACFKFPEHDTNSGDQRLLWIIRALRDQGDHVVVLARDANHPRYRSQLETMGIECVCDAEIELRNNAAKLRNFLSEQRFNAAILSSFGIYISYAWQVRVYLPDCHLALDTVDLNYLRLERESVFYPELIEEANNVKREELQALTDADSVWVVSKTEKTILESLLLPEVKPIHIVPSTHNIIDSTPDFSERAGIVFVGSYMHRPNADAVHYFMTDIFPLIKKGQEDVQITIAGSNPPPSFEQYRNGKVTITGYVNDHRALLLSHRIGIAPLRFGAGLKGKVLDYLACGLPCVTTSIGAEGMDLTPGQQMLICDNAAEFAANLRALYWDPDLWQSLSTSGKQFVNERYSYKTVCTLIRQACQSMKIAPVEKQWQNAIAIEHFYANPTMVFGLANSALAAYKRGGIDELRDRIRIWTRKPPT